MAAVKTERSTAGHVTPPRRPKDWTPPAKVIVMRGSSNGFVAPGARFPAVEASTDEQKRALVEFEAASKEVAKGKPGDAGAEGRYAVAYARLVQLGLKPRIRGRYRP